MPPRRKIPVARDTRGGPTAWAWLHTQGDRTPERGTSTCQGGPLYVVPACLPEPPPHPQQAHGVLGKWVMKEQKPGNQRSQTGGLLWIWGGGLRFPPEGGFHPTSWKTCKQQVNPVWERLQTPASLRVLAGTADQLEGRHPGTRGLEHC